MDRRRRRDDRRRRDCTGGGGAAAGLARRPSGGAEPNRKDRRGRRPNRGAATLRRHHRRDGRGPVCPGGGHPGADPPARPPGGRAVDHCIEGEPRVRPRSGAPRGSSLQGGRAPGGDRAPAGPCPLHRRRRPDGHRPRAVHPPREATGGQRFGGCAREPGTGGRGRGAAPRRCDPGAGRHRPVHRGAGPGFRSGHHHLGPNRARDGGKRTCRIHSR